MLWVMRMDRFSSYPQRAARGGYLREGRLRLTPLNSAYEAHPRATLSIGRFRPHAPSRAATGSDRFRLTADVEFSDLEWLRHATRFGHARQSPRSSVHLNCSMSDSAHQNLANGSRTQLACSFAPVATHRCEPLAKFRHGVYV